MVGVTRRHHLKNLLLITIISLIGTGKATNDVTDFTACNVTISDQLPRIDGVPDPNGVIHNDSYPDPIYHGIIRGFNIGSRPRPVTLTLQGCKDVCGNKADYNDVNSAFAILTTWVLPVIALLSSVPYESNNNVKNFEAFFNWFGAPAAALTTTIWNILMIRKCHKLSQREVRKQPLVKDTMYILSCINQYQYPRNGRFRSARRLSMAAQPLKGRRNLQNDDRIRDKALLRGVLFPFLAHPELATGRPLRVKLENITEHLAFQLRLQRRRGVFPLALSIIWFLLAFVISIVTAFAQLGDNTTAHSLALGLLLSWMPILVVALVVDRNPVGATRCGVLIERWLYNVDALFAAANLVETPEEEEGNQLQPQSSQDPSMYSQSPSLSQLASQPSVAFQIHRRPVPPNQQYLRVPDRISVDLADGEAVEMASISASEISPAMSHIRTRSDGSTLRDVSPNRDPPSPQQWRQDSDTRPFAIKDFVGQGRRLRYCAVTDTVLELHQGGLLNTTLPTDDDADEFRRRLPLRPTLWYVTWFVSQVLVTVAFSMAFFVSFKTPTIGLGCRSLSYLIWYLLSCISWWILFIWQEPPEIVRCLAWIPDILAVGAWFSIMGLQLTGALNTCVCKSSVFGSTAYGGYMDFENGEFYHEAYDVKQNWGIATGVGLSSCVTAIMWFYRRWSRDASMWRVNEDHKPELIDGVDLHWLT